jgi:hypothetical protein
MKMVSHQCPGKSIGYWQDIFIIQVQKMLVFLRFGEQIVPVVATVINVVIMPL